MVRLTYLLYIIWKFFTVNRQIIPFFLYAGKEKKLHSGKIGIFLVIKISTTLQKFGMCSSAIFLCEVY